MMRSSWILYLAILFVRVLHAEQLSVDLDKEKTKVAFVLTGSVHTVRGTFPLKAGHISFNTETRAMAGEVVVDATGGDSGSGSRDRRMTKDILEADRYPEARLVLSKLAGPITLGSPSQSEVKGSFTVHGQAHDITIPMQIQLSRQELTATGKFIVPYVQWGMKNPSNFLLKVNDKVEIELTVAGKVSGSPAR